MALSAIVAASSCGGLRFANPPCSLPSRPRLQAPEEVDHGRADLQRPFLLGPMTAAPQHDRRPKLGNEYRLLGNGLLKHGDEHVTFAHNVERRTRHRRSSKGSEQFPAGIDVAPPA